MTPVSLFTVMMDTSDVSGRMAASSSLRSTRPFVWTGRYVMSKPSSPSLRQESRTHLCSYSHGQRKDTKNLTEMKPTVCVVIMCLFFSLWKRATPLIDMLFVSVAPEVNTISFASAPIKSAICFRMTFKCQDSVIESNSIHTLRLSSTACSASQPYACVRLCGLPYWSVR